MSKDKKKAPPRPSPLELASDVFLKIWSRWERAYGRTSSAIASLMRFGFFPTATVIVLGWLLWDYGVAGYGGAQQLSSAEDSLFDSIIARRPIDPKSSGRVLVAEIDECSIAYFEKKGETGWPWPRDRHADLLTALGDAGVTAVGYDVMFLDKQTTQTQSDDMLLQVARLGAPAFFGASYDPPASDTPPTSTVDRWPTALPLVAKPKDTPIASMKLPFGDAMRKRSGNLNIVRAGDGVMRDFDVWQQAGDWGVPSMAALVAAQVTHRKFTDFPQSIRLNWRTKKQNRLQIVHAVDLLPDEHTPCLEAGQKLPDLKGKIVMVGYVASGINDYKPTPIDSQMAGVELQAEAVENLISSSYIRSPANGFKYALAALMVVLIGFQFWRGEPSQDIDAVFTAINLGITLIAVLCLTFSTYFFDIFAAVGVGVGFFGICRIYLAGMRGRALGNDDHVEELGKGDRLHVVIVILRVSVPPSLPVEGRNHEAVRFWETNEYRRLIRRILYSRGYGKMLENVIERKTWLWGNFRDVVLVLNDAPSTEELRYETLHDLNLAYEQMAEIAAPDRLDQVASASAVYVNLSDLEESARALALQNALGKLLMLPVTTSLRGLIESGIDCLPRWQNPNTANPKTTQESPPCETPSAP
jgi:CHASE2 domain-containing sensor protein